MLNECVLCPHSNTSSTCLGKLVNSLDGKAHVNCLRFTSGSLEKKSFLEAVAKAKEDKCVHCGKLKAALKCDHLHCLNLFHLSCVASAGGFVNFDQPKISCKAHKLLKTQQNLGKCAKCGNNVIDKEGTILMCCSMALHTTCANHLITDLNRVSCPNCGDTQDYQIDVQMMLGVYVAGTQSEVRFLEDLHHRLEEDRECQIVRVVKSIPTTIQRLNTNGFNKNLKAIIIDTDSDSSSVRSCSSTSSKGSGSRGSFNGKKRKRERWFVSHHRAKRKKEAMRQTLGNVDDFENVDSPISISDSFSEGPDDSDKIQEVDLNTQSQVEQHTYQKELRDSSSYICVQDSDQESLEVNCPKASDKNETEQDNVSPDKSIVQSPSRIGASDDHSSILKTVPDDVSDSEVADMVDHDEGQSDMIRDIVPGKHPADIGSTDEDFQPISAETENEIDQNCENMELAEASNKTCDDSLDGRNSALPDSWNLMSFQDVRDELLKDDPLPESSQDSQSSDGMISPRCSSSAQESTSGGTPGSRNCKSSQPYVQNVKVSAANVYDLVKKGRRPKSNDKKDMLSIADVFNSNHESDKEEDGRKLPAIRQRSFQADNSENKRTTRSKVNSTDSTQTSDKKNGQDSSKKERRKSEQTNKSISNDKRNKADQVKTRRRTRFNPECSKSQSESDFENRCEEQETQDSNGAQRITRNGSQRLSVSASEPKDQIKEIGKKASKGEVEKQVAKNSPEGKTKPPLSDNNNPKKQQRRCVKKDLSERDIIQSRNGVRWAQETDQFLPEDHDGVPEMILNKLTEFVDLNIGERKLLVLWNTFIRHKHFLGYIHLPELCLSFIEKYGEQIISDGLYRNCILHFSSLEHSGAIDCSTSLELVAKLQSMIKTDLSFSTSAIEPDSTMTEISDFSDASQFVRELKTPTNENKADDHQDVDQTKSTSKRKVICEPEPDLFLADISSSYQNRIEPTRVGADEAEEALSPTNWNLEFHNWLSRHGCSPGECNSENVEDTEGSSFCESDKLVDTQENLAPPNIQSPVKKRKKTSRTISSLSSARVS